MPDRLSNYIAHGLSLTTLAHVTNAAAMPQYHKSFDWHPKAISWHNCTGAVPAGIECATFAVPLDWSNVRGEQITLGMNRIKASGSRIGTLFINPGGPGGSATDTVGLIAEGAFPVSSSLLEHFDIVGLDPRGVSTSTPLQCDVDLWNERISIFPADATGFEELINHNHAVGESCRKLSGNLIDFIDTESVVNDLEAARLALGGEKLNFMGFSYGTQIAAQYAERFPDNIRSLVLDGNVDHWQTETSALVAETQTYEKELVRFAQWCQNATECALKDKDVLSIFDKLVQQADITPLPAPACTPETCYANVTGTDILLNAQEMLTFKSLTWPDLGLALAQAASGNATLLSTPLAVPDATAANSLLFSRIAVGCQDWFHSAKSVADLHYKYQLGASLAPHTKGATQSYTYESRCLNWPAPISNPPRRIMRSTKTPILMVNALYDPETSYTWAAGLREQLRSATLLTRDGDGHTSYPLQGEAARIIDAYLINGTMPSANTVVES